MNFDVISQAGLTQKEFAEVCGVTRTTVNLWRNGKMKPHRFISTRILAILSAMEHAVAADELPLKTKPPGVTRIQAIRQQLQANKAQA